MSAFKIDDPTNDYGKIHTLSAPTPSITTSNLSFGVQSFNSISSGLSNIVVGNLSADLLTTGDGNIVIGQNAGDTLTTGSNCIVIGQDADCDATGDNQVAIGNGVTTVANQITIGSTTNHTAGTLLAGHKLQVEELTASTTLTVADSGRLLLITTQLSTYEITLPAPTAGVYFTFFSTGALASDVTIVTASSANIIVGALGSVGTTGVTDLNADVITFTTTDSGGSNVTLFSDGSNWFMTGVLAVNGAITTNTTV